MQPAQIVAASITKPCAHSARSGKVKVVVSEYDHKYQMQYAIGVVVVPMVLVTQVVGDCCSAQVTIHCCC